MLRIHLSDHLFFSVDRKVDDRKPVAACGQGAITGVSAHVGKWGYGEGLIHPVAFSSGFHCPKCIEILKNTYQFPYTYFK